MKLKADPTSSPTSSAAALTMIRKSRRLSLYLLALLAFIVFVSILFGWDLACIFNNVQPPPPQFSSAAAPPPPSSSHRLPAAAAAGHDPVRLDKLAGTIDDKDDSSRRRQPFAVAEEGGGDQTEDCDVFSGRWVRDESSGPLYEEAECPYIQPQLTCQKHGRPDKEYQFWRWQPHGCSLPRFNATKMLEALRGKRMLYVGDSLNRGQYISMICLLHSLIPNNASKSMHTLGSLTVFTAKDYNATIGFYWAPFLLESNSDNAVVHRVSDRIIRRGSINKHGKYWKGADVVVFNTYLWWVSGLTNKILKGSFEDEEKELLEVPTDESYRMAMKSLVRWVEKNMDPKKNRVFFTTMSPFHERSEEWGDEAGGNCYNQTTPIEDSTYWGSGTRKSMMAVIADVFQRSKVPITVLNITQLSEYRKDAHTTIYKKQWSHLTPEQLANPVSYADCVHWCLPGLQDTWNELLFAKLFYPKLQTTKLIFT